MPTKNGEWIKGVSVENDRKLFEILCQDREKNRQFINLVLAAYQKETIVFPVVLGEF